MLKTWRANKDKMTYLQCTIRVLLYQPRNPLLDQRSVFSITKQVEYSSERIRHFRIHPLPVDKFRPRVEQLRIISMLLIQFAKDTDVPRLDKHRFDFR